MVNRLRSYLKSPYPAIGWTLIILVLCLLPKHQLPPSLGWDKLHHFSAFGLWAALWYWVKPKPFHIAGWGMLYGIAIEVWQGALATGRMFDWYDALADVLGIMAAIPIARWIDRKTMVITKK